MLCQESPSPGPMKPKPTGKPDHMLKFLEKNEIGNRTDKLHPPVASSAPRKRGRPAKATSTAGKSPKPKLDDGEGKTSKNESQFEAISDSESPEKTTPEIPKRKRGRPPKGKGEC